MAFPIAPRTRGAISCRAVSGSTPAAARRAARFGLPFGPPIHDEALNRLYLDECERLGVPVLDLYAPLLARAEAEGVDPGVYFFDYDHFSAKGSLAIAAEMGARMYGVKTSTTAD